MSKPQGDEDAQQVDPKEYDKREDRRDRDSDD